MNREKSFLQLKGAGIDRPRLDSLIELGLTHSLITVFAGPGYGKTHAFSNFFSKNDYKLIWQRATVLDNNVSHFSRNLIRSISVELPELAAHIKTFEIDDSDSSFEFILNEYAREASGGKRVAYVIDDFNTVSENEDIRHLIELLLSAHIENFCLVIITNKRTDIELAAIHSRNGVFRISSDDLKFTQDEIQRLFRLNNSAADDELINVLYKATDGWPLAVELILPRLKNIESLDYVSYDTEIDMPEIPLLFERYSFSEYDDNIKRLFVKLSLLTEFDLDTARRITDEFTPAMMEAINSNVFIFHHSSSRTYEMQSMYRDFLREKAVVLTQEELTDVYSCAAGSFLQRGKIFEAVELYYNCGDYKSVLDIFLDQKLNRMSASYAGFMLTYLEKLPESFVEENHFAQYLRAAANLNNMNVERSESILISLRDKLENDNSESARAVLGEVYLSLGGISLIKNNFEFCDYYKNAARLLPNGSALHEPNALITGGASTLIMTGNDPGALRETVRAYEEAVPYMEIVLNGCSRGLDSLVASEAAYYTFDLPTCTISAYNAVYKAADTAQHDIILDAYWILAKSALMQGNQAELDRIINIIDNYVNQNHSLILKQIRDSIKGWYHTKMGDFDKLMPWAVQGGESGLERPPIYGGSEQIIYADFLLQKQRYYELLALLERLEQVRTLRGFWIDVAYTKVVYSICHMRLGDNEKAMDYLVQAYDMTHANGIITPFVEMGSNMRALVDMARRMGGGDFDAGWLDSVYQKASTFAKKMSAMKSEYARRNNFKSVAGIKLSKREKEVLEALAQGMTREEIASNFDISVNTVKSNIKQIYNKLGAVNRADAIRLAASLDLID